MIPKFKEFFKPVLMSLRDYEPQRKGHIVNYVSVALNLSQDDMKETTKSGINKVYDRVTWACVYLIKASMLARPKKGWYQITELGTEVLNNEEIIDNKIIAKYNSQFANYQYIAGVSNWKDWERGKANKSDNG